MKFFKKKPKLNYITTVVDKTLTDIVLEQSFKAENIKHQMELVKLEKNYSYTQPTQTQRLAHLQHDLVEHDTRIKILRQIQDELREQEEKKE